ncbi:MAG: hypothetical protein FWE12_04960 [Oscillospiraceae bacterium]|nr:hypothetical protein [Oscillospiraceae bacterium]
MKHIRTRLTLIVFLAFSLVFLTACGGSGPPEPPPLAQEMPAASPPDLIPLPESPEYEEYAPAPTLEPPAYEEYDTPEPEEIPIEHPPLSPEAEFLSQFVTLFSMGWGRDAGELYNFDRAFIVDGSSGWFDRDGNEIETPSFLKHDAFVPVSYRLYDLDHGDMLTILIRFGRPNTSEGGYSVYRFVDGTFQEVRRFPNWGFAGLFRDNANQIVAAWISPNFMDYSYLTFSGNTMQLDPIIGEYRYFCEETQETRVYFRNHVTGESISHAEARELGIFEAWEAHHSSPEFQTNPTIFGFPDEPLTPIPPLTDLQTEINASIKARLGI